jgi:hypothetical protein
VVSPIAEAFGRDKRPRVAESQGTRGGGGIGREEVLAVTPQIESATRSKTYIALCTPDASASTNFLRQVTLHKQLSIVHAGRRKTTNTARTDAERAAATAR